MRLIDGSGIYIFF